MFRKAVPEVNPESAEWWVDKLFDRYKVDMDMAYREQRYEIIRYVYNRYLRLPKTATIRLLQENGIRLGEPLSLDGCGAILYRGSIDGGRPIILKKLEKGEYGGYKKVCEFTREVMAEHHLVSCVAIDVCSPPLRPPTFEISSAVEKSKMDEPTSLVSLKCDDPKALQRWIYMDPFPLTLKSIPQPIGEKVLSNLVEQLMAGLDFLHQKNIVHMDIKPSNIFSDQHGTFYLGDFGSATMIEDWIESTTVTFFPDDFRIGTIATKLHDYWMLAMTMHDITRTSTIGESGLETCERGMRKVLDKLLNLHVPAVNNLVEKIEKETETKSNKLPIMHLIYKTK